uniref:Uncharacterized protein n=1 Tax=Periophthalmus magnuspinnatus TaxID=409849 RepID=A0A3B4A730_9GOBI
MSTSRPLDLLHNDRKGIFIPLGRQLPRTPPSQDCVKQLDFKSCSNDPESMLKGMKGYRLTPADLEFMQRLTEEKELKKLQVNISLLCFVLVWKSDGVQLFLGGLPHCEDIRQWSMVVLEGTAPSPDFSSLDTKALLALVTEENAHKVLQEKRVELRRLEKMVENRYGFHAAFQMFTPE